MSENATQPAERPTPITFDSRFSSPPLCMVWNDGRIDINGTRDEIVAKINQHPESAPLGHLFVRITDLERQLADAREKIPDGVLLHRDDGGRIKIELCGDTFMGTRDALQSMIDSHNSLIDQLAEMTKQRNMLANAITNAAGVLASLNPKTPS